MKAVFSGRINWCSLWTGRLIGQCSRLWIETHIKCLRKFPPSMYCGSLRTWAQVWHKDCRPTPIRRVGCVLIVMRTSGYQTYLENEILSASPIELVQILYTAALDSIGSARRCVRAGDIRARSRAITKGMRIVTELSRSLNREAGGELSRNLANVYGYVLRLLIEGNAKQIEKPLAEAEQLLSTLADAWIRCAAPPAEVARSENEFGYGHELAASEAHQSAW